MAFSWCYCVPRDRQAFRIADRAHLYQSLRKLAALPAPRRKTTVDPIDIGRDFAQQGRLSALPRVRLHFAASWSKPPPRRESPIPNDENNFLYNPAANAEIMPGRSNSRMTKATKKNTEAYLRMYRQMVRIRTFEDNANQLYLSAKMPGLTHLYSGEEAVAVGICEALEPTDHITSTHRGHGHCIAKGAEFKRMFCELLGKEEGYCRGKGGSMHIADQDNGNLGANAIVGGSAGIATGAALTAKRRGNKSVTVCFFGDGALGQGLLYEVMNMAALWKLPVIYACENNQYGEYTHHSETAAGELTARATAFGIEAFEVDGQNVLEVNKLTQDLVSRMRNGDGPFFVLLDTYRFHGHHVGDIDRSYYRSKEEEQQWREARDPIKILGDWLTKEKIATVGELDAIRDEVKADAEAAVQYALDAPYPPLEEVDQHVYAA